MLDAQMQDKINRLKSKDFLVSVMLNEKVDLIKKELFASIFVIFKQKLQEFAQ